MAGRRCVARELAVVDYRIQFGYEFLRHPCGPQTFGYIVLGEHRHREVQFVAHEAEHGLVEFLIEGGIHIRLEIGLGRAQTLERLLGGLARPGSGHVRAAGSQLAQQEIKEHRQQEEGKGHYGECRRSDEEISPGLQLRPFHGNETYVLPETLHALLGHGRGSPGLALGHAFLSAGHLQFYRITASGNVTAGIDVVIGILDGRDGEVTVASRNEREFVGLAARNAAAALVDGLPGLHVIEFEVRRESDFRRLQQRDVAFAADGHEQGCRFVGAQTVLAHACADVELAHSAAEGSRRARRQRGDVHSHGRRGYALAHGSVAVVEERVENAAAPGGGAHVDAAHQFRRVYGQMSALLRNEHIFTYHRSVVYAVVHILADELYIPLRRQVLTPEAVEGREAGVVEAGYIHPLVEFQRCSDRLAHNGARLAQVESEI